MTDVDPADVSPWARDDWTGTDTPDLDALTAPAGAGGSESPRRPHETMFVDPEPAPASLSTGRPADGPSTGTDRPGVDDVAVAAADAPPARSIGRSVSLRSVVAGAVVVGALVVVGASVLRDDRAGETGATTEPFPASSVAGTPTGPGPGGPTTTLDPVAEELAARDAARTRAAAAEREAAEARAGAAGGVTPGRVVPGEIPPWTEWAIDVPGPLRAIADTELVMVTSAGVVHRLELPSGRVRTLIVPEPDPFDWKLAVGDTEIVLYENRDVVVLRDERPVQVLAVPESLLFLQHWPTTSSYVATTNPSPALAAERRLLNVDTGVAGPLTPEVVQAMPFGAAGFLTTGDLLLDRPGGTYAIGPDQVARRIDDGRLRAVGRNHYAVETCDESLQCAEFVVDARSGARLPANLSGIDPVALVDPSSHVSPDGRRIVFTDATSGTGLRQILDVETGVRFDVGRLEAIVSPDPWAADGSGIFTEVDGTVRFQRADTAESTQFEQFGDVAELLVRRR